MSTTTVSLSSLHLSPRRRRPIPTSLLPLPTHLSLKTKTHFPYPTLKARVSKTLAIRSLHLFEAEATIERKLAGETVSKTDYRADVRVGAIVGYSAVVAALLMAGSANLKWIVTFGEVVWAAVCGLASLWPWPGKGDFYSSSSSGLLIALTMMKWAKGLFRGTK